MYRHHFYLLPGEGRIRNGTGSFTTCYNWDTGSYDAFGGIGTDYTYSKVQTVLQNDVIVLSAIPYMWDLGFSNSGTTYGISMSFWDDTQESEIYAGEMKYLTVSGGVHTPDTIVFPSMNFTPQTNRYKMSSGGTYSLRTYVGKYTGSLPLTTQSELELPICYMTTSGNYPKLYVWGGTEWGGADNNVTTKVVCTGGLNMGLLVRVKTLDSNAQHSRTPAQTVLSDSLVFWGGAVNDAVSITADVETLSVSDKDHLLSEVEAEFKTHLLSGAAVTFEYYDHTIQGTVSMNLILRQASLKWNAANKSVNLAASGDRL